MNRMIFLHSVPCRECVFLAGLPSLKIMFTKFPVIITVYQAKFSIESLDERHMVAGIENCCGEERLEEIMLSLLSIFLESNFTGMKDGEFGGA